ncbi:Myb/SANT-like domain [Sesbania bispinosa]|nr:Myb/SANT-like domain [Sesbania bispinosa]
MTSNVDISESKIWPELVVKVFIDIMVDEATKGNMPNGVFHSRVWNSMTIRLNSLTKRSYKSPQLKAKMHRLRANYREFSLLLQHTGFGWNPDTNTVTANSEVWRDYLRTHDKAAQFQKKGLDHYKLLGILFNRSTATGVLHHSSNQDPPNTDEENELESQYLNVGSRVDVDNDSSDDDIHEVERTTRSGKRSSQMNDPKSKKKCRSNDMGEALSAWAEASKAKAEQYKVTSSRMSDHSITKCVTALEEIEDVPDDVYMKALEKFMVPEWREVFLAMSSDRRQAWLFRL